MSRLKKAGLFGAVATVATMAVANIGGSEGLRLRTYRDSIGVPTACYGETRNIRMGMQFTKPQCDAMFISRLDEFGDKLERCITRPMSDDTYVAFLSLSYNIGSGGFCKSSVARLYNAGDRRAACHAILKFDRAGGRVLAGLVTRRKREEALCLKGV